MVSSLDDLELTEYSDVTITVRDGGKTEVMEVAEARVWSKHGMATAIYMTHYTVVKLWEPIT